MLEDITSRPSSPAAKAQVVEANPSKEEIEALKT